MRWTRTSSLDGQLGTANGAGREVWRWENGDGAIEEFNVEVTLGKPFDVRRVKGANLDSARRQADFLRATAGKLYGPNAALNPVKTCPCCEVNSQNSSPVLAVHGATYRQCPFCGHVFVSPQPSPECFTQLFTQSDEHAVAYTEISAAEIRIEQIIEPKLNWALRILKERAGAVAADILDVGAGGGHFVQGCLRRGLRAQGIEISAASRRFARETFGIELRDTTLHEEIAAGSSYDLITMWGLLEYVPRPVDALRSARRLLRDSHGLLIAEVPRFDCMSSVAQAQPDAAIFRHLDPTSHVNCFSDSSIVTALMLADFEPVAAWYFGMDAHELLMQLALRSQSPSVMDFGADLLAGLQGCLDRGRACDDLVVAAIPRRQVPGSRTGGSS